jgi:hypothetical protein
VSAVPSALLDTTYLLPFLGIELRVRGVREDLARLLRSNPKLWFHPLSLVETKWVVLSLERRHGPGLRGSFIEGLGALLTDHRFVPSPLTSKAIETDADRLLDAGVQDYFDRMLAATAHQLPGTFLTEDRDLLDPNGPRKTLPGMRVTTLHRFLQQ